MCEGKKKKEVTCIGSGLTECQKQTFTDVSAKKVVAARATLLKISSLQNRWRHINRETFPMPAPPARVIASEMLLYTIYNAYSIGPVSMKS